MRTVPPRVLKEIRDFLSAFNIPLYEYEHQRESWIKHIDRALETRRSSKLARRRKAHKDIARQEKTADVRLCVWRRSRGRCECCDIPLFESDGELDHFFGGSRRRLEERVETCWFLCHFCHQRKTENSPSAQYWAERFKAHCLDHGYKAEAEMAMARF